jgi:hypothetical protein
MNICLEPGFTDAERRAHAYRGDVLLLPPRQSTLALAAFARSVVEAAFSPRDPRLAHRELEVAEAVQVLMRLKPHFIHHPETWAMLRRIHLDLGCESDRTFQDVPRLRVAYPKDYLSSGIAYADHPHRDTWYSAPSWQLNWWMLLYDSEASQAMAFHPGYRARSV